MIPLCRASVWRAIEQGKTQAGDWWICQRDGALYWRPTWGAPTHGHVAHLGLRLPALFPEGDGSRYCYLCLWARKTPMAPARRRDVLSLVVGAPSALNPTGVAFAPTCVVERFLTSEERAQWEGYLQERAQMLADTCLVALNDLSRRARFCYDTDSTLIH